MRPICYLILSLVAGLPAAAPAGAAEPLPVSADVDLAGLRSNVRQILEALRALKQPVPAATAKRLQPLLDAHSTDEDAARKIQQLLDPACLVAVNINPESRVKARRGPAAAELVQDRPAFVLVKIYNEAGVTHALAVGGPQVRRAKDTGAPGRWLQADVSEHAPLKRRLSGKRVEYVVLRLLAHEVGKREATLRFDVGQGTQDLGFRAEVPILFTVRPAGR